MTPLERLTDELAYPVKTPAAGHDWVGVRADDLALVLAVVEAAQNIKHYGFPISGRTGEFDRDYMLVSRTEYAALRAALAAIEGAKE